MRKRNIIGLVVIALAAANVQAQTMTAPAKAKSYGVNSTKGVMGLYNVGFIGNKEILRTGNSFKVFEGDKEVNQDFLSNSFDKKDGINLFFKPNEVLFVRADNALDNAPVQIQAYDASLKPKGQPTKIGDLSLTLTPVSKGSGGSVGKRTIDIETFWNETTGNILVYCHVGSYGLNITGGRSKSSSTPYVKLILLDKDFNVLSTYAQESSEEELEINAISPNVVTNGDAIAIINQSSKSKIMSNYLVHLSNGKDAVLTEILPDNSTVLSYNTSINSKDDKVIVSILSQEQKEDKNRCVVGVYTYNLKTGSADRKAYPLTLGEIDLRTMPDFKWLNFEEVQILKDGSALVFLNATVKVIEEGKVYSMSHGLIFMKIKPNGDLAWIRPIEKLDRGYIGVNDMNDVISYLNSSDDLEVIFNVGRSFYNNGNYKIGNAKGAPWINQMGGHIPMKVTLDLETGSVLYNELKFGGKKVTALFLGESQKLDTPGKYTMRLFIDGDAHNTIVDFTK